MENALSLLDSIQCIVEEWDGTLSPVEAVLWADNEIRIRYKDGVVHSMSVDYFNSVFRGLQNTLH